MKTTVKIFFLCELLILSITLIVFTGEEALTLVLTKVKEGLEGVEKQPENAEKYSGLEKGPATYGVVKRARDNDMDLHSNQTVCLEFFMLVDEPHKMLNNFLLRVSFGNIFEIAQCFP